jgi:hypothetical protein
MTITNITPREQELALELTLLKTERDLLRKLVDEYRKEADTARELLDKCRNIIREMDQKAMRGKV